MNRIFLVLLCVAAVASQVAATGPPRHSRHARQRARQESGAIRTIKIITRHKKAIGEQQKEPTQVPVPVTAISDTTIRRDDGNAVRAVERESPPTLLLARRYGVRRLSFCWSIHGCTPANFGEFANASFIF